MECNKCKKIIAEDDGHICPTCGKGYCLDCVEKNAYLCENCTNEVKQYH